MRNTSERTPDDGEVADDLMAALDLGMRDAPTDTTPLTAQQELNLGLDVERWILLKDTRTRMASEKGSDPDTPELAAALMMTTCDALNLLRIVGAVSDMNAPPDAPASELLSSPKVRKLLDIPLPDAMKERLADAIGVPVEEIGKRVSALAKASAVIPPATFRLAENELRPRLYDNGLDTCKLAKAIEPDLHLIEFWWEVISARGQVASERLTSSNLRLVVSVARRYQGRGLPFSDLIQEGNLGLASAVEKYDPRRGYKFSAYATWWIQRAVTRALADRVWRVERTLNDMVIFMQNPSALAAEERMMDALMREELIDAVEDAMNDLPPRLSYVLELRFGFIDERKHTLEEVGRKLGVTRARVWQLEKQAFELMKKSWKLSIFKENISPEDFIQYTLRRRWAPDDMAVKVKALMREDLVSALVDALPPRLRLVLAFRFGFIDDRPRSLEEVGRELGVTRERVHQLEKQALGLLKSSDKLPQTPRDFIEYILERRGALD